MWLYHMFGSNLLQRTMAYAYITYTRICYIHINVGNEKNNRVLIIFIIRIYGYTCTYVGTSKATIKIGESRAQNM